MLTEMLPPTNKKELQSFLGIMNYLAKFSPVTVEICEAFRRLTSLRSERMWNSTYQHLYERVKAITKKDAAVAFYDGKEQLHLETDVSDVGLRASLLQVRDGMWYLRNEAAKNAALQPRDLLEKPDQHWSPVQQH